ncbi:MAG: hypothetical protein JWR67_3794 [Mucilaginibacter sp.]|nr:hypothetical protein [Mucilaginibacter sp.]
MRRFYIIFLVSLLHFTAHAQDTVKKVGVVRRSTLDTNRVVYDEQGNALRYYQYVKLMNTGGYTIRTLAPPGSADAKLYLKKVSAQENLKSYELLKSQLGIQSPLLQEGKKLDVTPLLRIISQEELNKKAIVLIFWAVDCPPCTESFEGLNDFFRKIANPEDMIVIAITRDAESIAQAKLIQKPLLHARLLSNAGSVLNYYQLKTYPSYVVADKDRVIRFASSGLAAMTMPVFKSTISQILIQ